MAALKAANPAASLPSWAIRFAASLENVMVVLSGMSSVAQTEDNLSYTTDFVPLTGEEKALVVKAAGIVNSQIAVPCTCCSRCTNVVKLRKYRTMLAAH